jgi:hypothetical protein
MSMSLLDKLSNSPLKNRIAIARNPKYLVMGAVRNCCDRLWELRYSIPLNENGN